MKWCFKSQKPLIVNYNCKFLFHLVSQVKASYKYQAEDMDELAFEVGEIINVVEYDDPEEQVCPGVNFINILAQSANALVVILRRR